MVKGFKSKAGISSGARVDNIIKRVNYLGHKEVSISPYTLSIIIGEKATIAEKTSAEIVQKKLKNLLGENVSISGEVSRYNKRNIIIGTCRTNGLISNFVKNKKIILPNKDGYVIKLEQDENVYLAATVSRGCIYGAFYLEENLQVKNGKFILTEKEVKREPVFEYRFLMDKTIHNSGNPLDHIENFARYGMNTVLFGLHLSTPTLQYNLFRKEIEKISGEKIKPVSYGYNLKEIEIFRKAIDKCHKYGLNFCYPINEVNLNEYLVEKYCKIHPECKHVAVHNYADTICPKSPRFWDYYRDHLNEIMLLFPGIDIILITIADNRGDIFCGCNLCKNYSIEDRIKDFVNISYNTLKKVKNEIKIIIRFHNIGDWYRYNFHLNIERLVKTFPEDIIWESKWSAPPSFDFTWHSSISPHFDYPGINKMVTLGYDNRWILCPSGYFFTLPYKRIKEDIAKFASIKGIKGIMFQNNQLLGEYTWHLIPYLGKLSWDPFSLNAERHLIDWFTKRFGEASGKLIFDGLRDSDVIANKLQPLPFTINPRKQLRDFKSYEYIASPYYIDKKNRNICAGKSAMKILTKSINGFVVVKGEKIL